MSTLTTGMLLGAGLVLGAWLMLLALTHLRLLARLLGVGVAGICVLLLVAAWSDKRDARAKLVAECLADDNAFIMDDGHGEPRFGIAPTSAWREAMDAWTTGPRPRIGPYLPPDATPETPEEWDLALPELHGSMLRLKVERVAAEAVAGSSSRLVQCGGRWDVRNEYGMRVAFVGLVGEDRSTALSGTWTASHDSAGKSNLVELSRDSIAKPVSPILSAMARTFDKAGLNRLAQWVADRT